MPDIQFSEEDNIKVRKTASNIGLASKLVKWGIVKNESQANILLIVIIAIGFGVTILNTMSLLKTPDQPKVDGLKVSKVN